MNQAFVFPGQGSQFSGMGKDLYEQHALAKKRFEQANEILGFRLTDIMFSGTEEALKQTNVTQPAIFLHSVVMAELLGEKFAPQAVAGHSLGEFSALVAAGSLRFEDGLTLVQKRALAMQKACEEQPSTMAAIIGLDDDKVEEICRSVQHEVVVPANYNTPGQLVISGSVKGIEIAIELLKGAGAKLSVVLNVGGAFHSPLMQSASAELQTAIEACTFAQPVCPVFQNVDAKAYTQAHDIKSNLVKQLTSPVYWTQTINHMADFGIQKVVECGPGTVLQKMTKKINRTLEAGHVSEWLH